MADSFVSRFGCYTIIRDTTSGICRACRRMGVAEEWPR